MSLDITLYAKDENNQEYIVFDRNITHNLAAMAREAGLYEAMWQPHENSIDTAINAIAPLKKGIIKMHENEEHFNTLNPDNGWGTYHNLLSVANEYLEQCRKYPKARIEVSR